MSQCFEIYARTETGPVRAANEDHVLVGRFIKNRGGLGLQLDADDELVAGPGFLLAVADGIGGAAGGKTASWLALTAIERYFDGASRDSGVGSVRERLGAAIRQANELLLKTAAARPELQGMGSTLTGLCLTAPGYLVFNAGDSRVYRHRDGVLKRLTTDDTVTSLAIRTGHLTVAQATASTQQHVLTNCLGATEFDCTIEDGPPLRAGDRLLICSDGLHGLVADEEIERLLNGDDVTTMGQGLVARAIEAGGHDNVSLILIRPSP